MTAPNTASFGMQDTDSREDRQAAAPGRAGGTLLNRDFVLLFLLTLFSNCSLAIYYCFEQWLLKVSVEPAWRGLLLGALFGMITVTRPVASIFMLRVNKLPAVILSLLVASGVLMSYQALDPASPLFPWLLLGLRIAQGFFVAILSACVVSLIADCIPPEQGARGFAIFSLAGLLPYALLPAAGELLLPLAGSEAVLFAWTAFLMLPCLIMVVLLAPRLGRPGAHLDTGTDFASFAGSIVRGVLHSGLGLVFASQLTFCLVTQTCIFFIKGLCTVTGTSPAQFFFWYIATLVVVRIAGNRYLDSLPCYRSMPFLACAMASSLLIIAWGPAWLYIPAILLYGVAVSIMYPLMAAVIFRRSTDETRAVNSNISMLMFDAAGLFSPLLGGIILNTGSGYQAVITTAGIMALASGVLFVLDGLRPSPQVCTTKEDI